MTPFKANFDFSLSNDSVLLYLQREEFVTVEWKNVELEERPELGKFTFQVSVGFCHQELHIIYDVNRFP